MSLIRQLWLAIIVISVLVFSGSFGVSTLTARHYLEQQLYRQSVDTANSLALSMTQQSKDPVILELQVAALFDGGHYQSISLTDPRGKTIVDRIQTRSDVDVPEWFVALFPIKSLPARAQVTDGWKQFGVVTVVSHNRFAYQALWRGLIELAGWFALAALGSGLIGTLVIRGIRRPLDAVVGQAHAITERRFISIEEPRTLELRSMVRAMNDMVGRLRQMFSDEAARLESLRHKVNHDAVTGLSNRDYFMAHFREILLGEEFGRVGCLVLLRIKDLNELNSRLGHARADSLLKELGAILWASGDGRIGQRAGRMKGAEFAIVCPTFHSATEAATDIIARLSGDFLQKWSAEVPDLFHLAAVQYQRGQNPGEVLARADQALAVAQTKGPNGWHAEEGEQKHAALPAEQWRVLLTEAVSAGHFQLSFYPVVAGGGQSLHQEGVIRLRTTPEGPLLAAGDFMPMAARLNLTAPLDLGVVRLAIRHLETTTGEVAVNLSAETLSDWEFRNNLRTLLKEHPLLCKRLWFEVPEYGVFRHFDAFQELCKMLKALGCRVGIEHFGQRFAEGQKLADLGLDYIKVHASYIRGIDQNPGNQEFLKGLCNVAHAIGIVVIAVGVQNDAEMAMLRQLGFDGATGPGVKA
ncbi:MAG TPA: EAL domain-containing protein [Burkholderiales bacterium]|nr:EAL domain-containing protein [Burkholderiales bacterium]